MPFIGAGLPEGRGWFPSSVTLSAPSSAVTQGAPNLGCAQGRCLLTFPFPFVSPGIALYPRQAQLLSCKHHYEVIPPLRSPGQPGDMNCTTQRINYTDPFSNQTLVTLSGLGSPGEHEAVLTGSWLWLAHLHSARVTLGDFLLADKEDGLQGRAAASW